MMKITKAECYDLTLDYYSHFCDFDLKTKPEGIHFVCTKKREEVLKGYGNKVAIYALFKDNSAIISYSPEYEKKLEGLKDKNLEALRNYFKHQMNLWERSLFVFEEEKINAYGEAFLMTLDDYPLYKYFFKELNPDCDDSWLYDYYCSKLGYFCAYQKDKKIISLSDGPDMPYLDGRVQHTGIWTKQAYRHHGYATKTCALATNILLEKGICPQWECASANKAAVSLAKKLGYKPYAKAFMYEI